MKQFCKRSLAAILLLVMVVGYFAGVTIRVNAASYTYNWGTRGKVATELSDAAEAWYSRYGTSYEELSSYSGASSTSSVPSSALYSQLKTLMTNAHSYKTSYDATKDLYQYTDCQNGGGKISSFYSGASIGPGWGEGGSWNREHTWPNSKGLGGQDENDIMMLRPTTTSENSSRGNEAFGKSGGSYYDPNSESSGKYNLHGDVARICLYVYVRWGNTSRMWGSSGVMESKEVLLEWMEEDPVDTWELGRNDAVQSITGTRNVFVDYPELAFDLFNADVPDGYQSPSGSAPSYTITATSNNTSYGTVSLSGKTITATPKTGYQVSGYKVTSGTATVTRSGNTFTVSASSDCTIQIIFAARTKATLTFVDQGKTVSTLTPYTGDSVTLPADPGFGPDGFVFLGWVEQQIQSTETKPAVYAENSAYSVTASKTFYALYAKVDEGSTGEIAYRLVTDMSQLSHGASVVITSAASALAMKQNGGTNNRYAGTITKNADNTITFDETLIDVLTLGAGTTAGTYSFYSQANGQYLAAGTSSGDNKLILQSSVDAAASFAITVTSAGVATVISQTSSDRNTMKYNSSANIFSCYASGQKDISLYVSSGSGVAYYTTDPNPCDHENTENVAAVAATCTESGYTAGVYCTDCDTYVSGHEVVEALGHSYGAWQTTTAPTCTASGVQTSICSACGSSKTQSVAATGHDYEATVTPPTATEQGYTTYTCSVCGDSYTGEFVYTVRFSVPSGVAAVANMECGASGIKLPTAGVPTGDYEYTFVGWTTAKTEDTAEEPETFAAGKTYTATANTTLYAVYSYVVESEDGGNGDYVKVTEKPADWSGEYLIVYESGSVVFDSSLSTMDANNNNQSVTISNSTISAEKGDAYKVVIAAMNGGYSIYTVSGKYIGASSDSNSLNSGSTAMANTITMNSDQTVNIVGSGGAYLRYNTSASRFRYYKSSTYTGQKAISLYVKRGSAGTTYYTTVIGEENPVESWNISLGDNIGVSFVMNTEEAVSFTVAGKAVESVQNGNTYSIYLAAAQMTDEIVISVGGKVLEETYSVRKYADAILSGDDDDAKNLVKAMLCYGGAAQTYFGYNTTNLASSGISSGMAVPTGDTALTVTDDVDGIDFYGASLVHENRIAVRFYFSGSIDGLAFSQGTPVQKGDLYYIEVADINPQNIGETIEIVVSDGANSLTVGYSPLTYIVRMYEKADSSEVTKNLVYSLYNYYLAAVDYLAA